MKNKKELVKSFLTTAMLWAAFATTNYNPAIASDYTIDNYNDLNNALSGQEFGDSLNPSQLQTGENVILGGSINADSSINVVVDNVTINGGGSNSYTYTATGNAIDGFITGVGTNIENISMSGFDNAITVNSGNTLNFSESLLQGNNIGILNNGTANISNVTISDGILNNGTVDFSGLSNISNLNSSGDVSNSGNLLLTNENIEGSYTQTAGSLGIQGETTISNSNTNITGGDIAIANSATLNFNNGTIGENVEITINSGSNFKNSGNITLNSDDTIASGSSISQTSGTINSDGFMTKEDGGNLNVAGGNVNILSNGLTLNNADDNIQEGATVNLNGNLAINEGSVKLNSDDTLASGTITQNGGSLSIDGISTGFSTLTSTNGDLTLNNTTLSGNDSVTADVKTTIGTDGVTITDNVNVALDSQDNWNGQITLNSINANLSLNEADQNNQILDAQNGNLNSTNTTLTIGTGSQIAGDVTASLNGGSLSITGTSTGGNVAGQVALDNLDTWNTATSLTGDGTLNLNGVIQGDNSTLSAISGNLNLDSQTLTIGTGSQIAEAVATNIANNSSINILEMGNVTLNGTGENADNLTLGAIQMDSGSLSLINFADIQGVSVQTTGGNLLLNEVALNNSNNSVNSDTRVTITNNVELTNGNYTIDNNDNWAGNNKITLSGATLNYDNRTTNGLLDADSGILNIGELNTSDSTILNIAAGSSISEPVQTTLNGVLNVSGGDVVLDGANNDTLESGSINLSDGNLALSNLTTDDVNLNATGGALELNGVQLNNQQDNIEFDSTVTFNGDVNITKGNVEIDSNDILTTGTITLNQLDGATATLGVDGLKTNNVNLSLQKGVLNIVNNGLELNNTSDIIQKEITTNVNGNLTINEGKVLLNEDDSWNSGMITVSSNGMFQFENFEATSNSDTTLKMDGANSLTELISSTVTFGNAENISDGTIAIDYDSGILIQSGSYNLSNMKTSGSISTINGTYENHTADTMTILNNTTSSAISGNDIAGDGFSAFGVDLYARNANNKQNSDVFKGTNLTLSDTNGTGEVYIADYVLNGRLTREDAPIDRYYNFKIFDYENIDPNITISATDKETFTPIGYYRLFSNGDGSYTLGLTRYNKQVFRLQATTLAQYNNQLAVDDMVTSHHTLFGERKLANANYNRFASATPNLGPYQYSQQDGGLWFKSYADLERLSMTQDLNVHNTAYGAIVGADFPIVNLKRGWKFIPTPYIGYNGAHQSFNDVSAYQTGGQLGFMGTFMKNNFISSHTIYGGGYYNELHVDDVLDNTGNWFWGTAHRFAYNWNIKDHFIIQPTAFISYNMFGEQNLHSDFGDMGMRAGMLNGVNIAPGVNFIYAEKDWSAYLGVQYMYNINEQVSGRAGNVYLPNLAMRHGYIQYGIGGTRNIKDDLSAYAQVMFRNAGRTGVAFQLGLQYYFDIHEIGSKIKNGCSVTLNKIKSIKKDK